MKSFREILTDIRNNRVAPVYILMGEEPFYLDAITDALEETVVSEDDKVFDQTLFFGADSLAATVMEVASRYPVISPRQLVILKEAQAMQHAKSQLEVFKSYVENPTSTTVLAIVYKGGKINATSSLLKAASKNKDVVVFESKKIRDYQLPGVVKDYCRSEKIAIEDRAVGMLCENVGNSLGKIFSEIEKLKISLSASKTTITGEDVERNVGVSKEFNNFELVSAMSRKDYYQSLRIVKYFTDNPKSNPAIVTASTLFNFFQKVLIAHYSKDKSEKGLMAALQAKTTYALREIYDALHNYNVHQATSAIRAIREFDAKSKGIGSFQKEHALLQELVFSIITC